MRHLLGVLKLAVQVLLKVGLVFLQSVNLQIYFVKTGFLLEDFLVVVAQIVDPVLVVTHDFIQALLVFQQIDLSCFQFVVGFPDMCLELRSFVLSVLELVLSIG